MAIHLHLVFVGKTNFPEIEAGISRYLERLRHFAPTEIHIVKGEKVSRKISEAKLKEIEAKRILNLLGKKSRLILWDRRGREYDSEEFAYFLDRLRKEGKQEMWMAIGGPLGFSRELIGRADFVLSLSRLTFPHDLARLIVVEQLYRAFTILGGIPYHK